MYEKNTNEDHLINNVNSEFFSDCSDPENVMYQDRNQKDSDEKSMVRSASSLGDNLLNTLLIIIGTSMSGLVMSWGYLLPYVYSLLKGSEPRITVIETNMCFYMI